MSQIGLSISNAEYHAHPAMSKSRLWRIFDSPEKFKYYEENPKDKSSALIFGTAFHKIVLEPNEFDEEFLVLPSIDRRTKEGKERFKELMESANGRDVMSHEDYQKIVGMRESVLSNKYAKALVEKSDHELSFFWKDELTGELCKCRPDILFQVGSSRIIADLKSCESAKTEDFMRDAIKYGYHVQAYMYKEGLKQNTSLEYQFVFIAVEKKPPYSINIMKADDIFVRYGEDTFRELIGVYSECKSSGNWWGYNGFSGIINTLGVPAWVESEYR